MHSIQSSLDDPEFGVGSGSTGIPPESTADSDDDEDLDAQHMEVRVLCPILPIS